MRKILNLSLVFILSIVVVGLGFANVEAAATTDVTINLHIHQIDGDYTNTGSGAWDGVKWNNWDFEYDGAYATVTQSTDDFGKFISIVYTADQINLVANSIQFKPTRDTGVDESANYLVPGNGEVFADVTSLKDGSATTLDLYYVEGASEFVLGEDGLGLLFVVYVDPTIAGGEPVYDEWEMWNWDNGTDGTADLLEFNQDLSIKSGIYNIEGRLGVIHVDDDATQDTGFKFRLGEWVEQTANYSFDNTDIRGTGAAVVHIEKGVTPYYADGATFSAAVHESYELLAGNKFLDTTLVTTPTTITASMLVVRDASEFVASRFRLLDVDGVEVPILSVSPVGTFTSDFTPGVGEKTVIIHFNTSSDHSRLGVVGNFVRTWNIDDMYLSTKDDSLGYAVFELPTTTDTGEFKIKYDGEDDGVFGWDSGTDPELTAQLSYDLTGIDSVEIFIGSDGTATYVIGSTEASGAQTETVEIIVDSANELQFGEEYTLEYDELELENYVTVYVDSALDHTKLGIVGTIQGWDITTPIMSTQDDVNGYAVFEFVLEESEGSFILIFDDLLAFDWDDKISGDDDLVFEVDGELVIFIDDTFAISEATPIGTFTSDLTLGVGEKTVIIHFETTEDHARLGVVGNFVRDWNIDDVYTSTKDDTLGYAIFELPTTTDTGEFKIKYDGEDDGVFGWDSGTDPELTGQLAYDLTGVDSIVLYINAEGQIVDTKLVGAYTQEVTPVIYVDTIVISKILQTDNLNEFIKGDAVAGTGTYAVTETELVVEFMNAIPFMTDIVLVDSSETVIAVESVNYTYGMGEYTETVSCPANAERKLLVYLNILETEITDYSQLGLVGSLQGWNPSNAINPVGMDSLGNYVFEICLHSLDGNDIDATFKVLFDADGEFDWEDDQMTPGDVNVTIVDVKTFYIEEGNVNSDTKYQIFTLLEANALSTDETYQLRFTDDNGFLVYLDLEIDNIGPVLYDTIKADVEFNIEKGSDFDIMDYYNIFEYIDTRAGNIDYVITSDIDTSVLGAQTFTVTATDLWMNESTFSVDFTVIDTIAPVITLSTAPELEVGDTEPDWATYATANEGTIVVDSSQVDMSVAGTYFINYTATDGEDNESSLSLEVTIDAVEVPVEDTTGCFGSIGNGSAFIIFGIVAVLGGAALFFLRRV